MIYTVRSGETLSDVILNSTGSILNWEDILNANGFTDWSPELYVGQQIIIPDDIIGQSNVKNVLDTYPANNNSIASDFDDQVTAFITSMSPPTITDIDGNIYHYITIGTQQWLVENLKTTKYADNTPIPNFTSDWFLPAADELVAVYDEITAYAIGNFTGTEYWSSSEQSPTQAQVVYFNAGPIGTIGVENKDSSMNVLFIRQFNSTSVYSLRDIGPLGGWIFHIINIGGGNYTYYEVAKEDYNSHGTSIWSNIFNIAIGTTGTAIGTGQANTTAIIGQVGHTTSAAKLCDDLTSDMLWSQDITGAYCWYDNDIANKPDYGALYNWYAATNAHGIAPTGWRVPTETDFDILVAFIGGGTNGGGKLKEDGITHWNGINIGATNEYGFNGIGSGWRDENGSFYVSGTTPSLGYLGHLHSSTGSDIYSRYLYLRNSSGSTEVDNGFKKYGFAIRLMRDV